MDKKTLEEIINTLFDLLTERVKNPLAKAALRIVRDLITATILNLLLKQLKSKGVVGGLLAILLPLALALPAWADSDQDARTAVALAMARVRLRAPVMPAKPVVPTPTPAPAKPAVKVRPCSVYCTCGCNQDQPCSCATLSTATGAPTGSVIYYYQPVGRTSVPVRCGPSG